MKKLVLIIILLLNNIKLSFAFNFGAPASTQPGWESDGNGIIGILFIIFLIWLFWNR